MTTVKFSVALRIFGVKKLCVFIGLFWVVMLLFFLGGCEKKRRNIKPEHPNQVSSIEPETVVNRNATPVDPELEETLRAFADDPPPEMKIKLIPAGQFWMGCVPDDNQCGMDEKPRRKVYLDAFYMDEHEVTVAEYAMCILAGVCEKPQYGAEEIQRIYYNGLRLERKEHPVNGVSWFDAQAYCRWQEKRLPTEAEFERALRGGREDLIFPWGNEWMPPADYGNYPDETQKKAKPDWPIFSGYDDGYAGTAPVCSFRRNPYGFCDLSGNVWEWCEDVYFDGYYITMPRVNPVNRDESVVRVLRGGSFTKPPSNFRASNRSAEEATFHSLMGFRCVRTAEKKKAPE